MTSPLVISVQEGTVQPYEGSLGLLSEEGVDSAHLMNSKATWGSINLDNFSTSSITILNGLEFEQHETTEIMVAVVANFWSTIIACMFDNLFAYKSWSSCVELCNIR